MWLVCAPTQNGEQVEAVEGADIQNLIKGKPRGTKRTEIGQTMAMFRGESFDVSQLDEAVDPKEMLKIFNGLNKGDTIKVKFKSVIIYIFIYLNRTVIP